MQIKSWDPRRMSDQPGSRSFRWRISGRSEVGEGEKEGSGEGDFPLKEGYNDSHIPPMPPRDEK